MISHAVPRPKVLWFGEPPPTDALREYQTRGLVVQAWDGVPSDPDLVAARGAVYSLSNATFDPGLQALSAAVHHLVNHGLYICVGLPGGSDALLVRFTQRGGEGLLNERWSRVGAGLEPHEFAERIARHAPGPASSMAFAPI